MKNRIERVKEKKEMEKRDWVRGKMKRLIVGKKEEEPCREGDKLCKKERERENYGKKLKNYIKIINVLICYG